ncbi:PREDICTED: tropomyosin alpha-1 chain-like [Nicotiana attenuata]|uniref:tropomyosin alpha-1 chain-like n=1 Tax=Nicotiana attenuata TaxID=49451 RepID=UPI000904EC2C|nr:PREDICTED: tropomyosin alpha-1 chain-like [Nicotiana attenuata]
MVKELESIKSQNGPPKGPMCNSSLIKRKSNGTDAADEGEKKKLARENEALRAQIQRMKIAAENQVRSRADEKLINGLKRKVYEYENDLEKSEGRLARARAKLAKNAEGRAGFVQQLKEKYDREVANLKKKLTTRFFYPRE